ncbi:hypothetical protein [Dokdonella sp.]|uniref:hypothetical protein n=1 Tax=Dokdonella sp. TaxID=2291710 RepID=UPI0031BFF856|nr:hypothetical protein [Dokdonella sp.]
MAKELPSRRIAPAPARPQRLARAVLDVAGRIPPTVEEASATPERRALAIARAAASRAALAAGALSLPPGPLGWFTVLPELTTIWQIQRRMVADIAGAFGTSAQLTRSQMLYCLFRHAAAQAVRDLGVHVGARFLIQEAPLRVVERVAARIGVDLSRRTAARSLARWLPAVGTLGIGAYAYYDTRGVARTAMILFAAAAAAQAEAAEVPAG